VHNYYLSPPTNLVVYGKPVTVREDSLLCGLLKPGVGDVCWAACR
jgi:hypothetical protein